MLDKLRDVAPDSGRYIVEFVAGTVCSRPQLDVASLAHDDVPVLVSDEIGGLLGPVFLGPWHERRPHPFPPSRVEIVVVGGYHEDLAGL